MSDVTIVGAGPAGATAAILLARRGWSVTLIEQHRFPRDKVCGECVSQLGIEVLGRLDLLASLRELGAIQLRRAAIHPIHGRTVELPLPRPMLGISRRAMDDLLFSAARAAGATVLQPARCEALRPGPMVRIRDLASNEVRELRASWVIVADGKSSLLPRPPLPTRDLGIKAHFQDVDGPRDTIELFGCRGHYGGLAAIEDGLWNAAFSVPTRLLRDFRGDIDATFEQMKTQNPALHRRLRHARRVGSWLASPLPRFAVRRRWPAGVVCVGNAAAALEPIGGEGIGLALRSAELAAEALAIGSNPLLPYMYARLWNIRRAACRGSAVVISDPLLARLALPLLGAVESVQQCVLRAVGKDLPCCGTGAPPVSGSVS